ncbi:ionotropic receptor 21a-like [Panulirus ornatus]|uniref:ionotropic receptor 21a-like n=1 Tax=Panulirus ornatus TaxID=150431 RepID=UPI003A84EA0A
MAVMSQVLSGPLRGGTMVVYLDDAIPRVVQEAIMTLEAVQETPHVTLSLGANQTWWPDQQAPAFIHGGSFVLHLVLFLTNPTKFLQSLWTNWKPRYLLLFSLASSSSDATVLNHDVFNSVQKVALIMVLPDELRGRPRTMGVYTLQPFSSSTPLFLGEWNKEQYSEWDSVFIDRYPNFGGYRFELATWYNNPPFLYQKDPASDGSREGVTLKMLDAMASKMNFTYTTTLRSPDLKWGGLENGTWDGVLGVVQRKEKNFTVNHFYQTPDRLRDFDISTSCWNDGFGVFLLRPQPLPQWVNIYRPFQPQVWAVLLATSLLAMGHMTFMERVQRERFLGGCVVGTWLYLQRGMFGQGVPALPRALWQRMFLAVWYLYCLLVSIYYTSNLVAIFTSPANPQRIHTLQQLADSGYRLAMVDDGASLPSVLRRSRDDVYMRLYTKLDLLPLEEEAAASMLAGTHALVHTTAYVITRLTGHYKVFNWYLVKEQFQQSYISWCFPKHTPWKYKFDQDLQRMVGGGLVQHWFKVEMETLKDWKRQQQESLGQPTNMFLTLQHLQGIFYILILAWAASVAVRFRTRFEEKLKGRLVVVVSQVWGRGFVFGLKPWDESGVENGLVSE